MPIELAVLLDGTPRENAQTLASVVVNAYRSYLKNATLDNIEDRVYTIPAEYNTDVDTLLLKLALLNIDQPYTQFLIDIRYEEVFNAEHRFYCTLLSDYNGKERKIRRILVSYLTSCLADPRGFNEDNFERVKERIERVLSALSAFESKEKLLHSVLENI